MPAMDAVMTTAPRCPSLSGACCATAAAASRSTLYVPTRYRSIVLVKPPSVAGEPSRWTTFSAMPKSSSLLTGRVRAAPCCALSSEQFENRRVGLPAALAHGLQAVADAVVAHVVHEGGHQPGAAAAERVAERDRAPVGVQRLGVRAELGEPGEGYRREGLVYLEGTDVADSQPALGQGLRGRRDGRGEHDDRVVGRQHRGVHP